MKALHTLFAVALVAVSFSAAPARAAESHDACAGRYITSLPAAIGTQGIWCLSADLATGISTGNAISVNVPNVTIDCNGNKLSNLTAGPGSSTAAIRSTKDNTRVQNCHVRGFGYGAWLSGKRSEVVDSRFEGATRVGIYMTGGQALVRGNRVHDTGGNFALPAGISLVEPGEIRDNVVDGVWYLGAGNTTLYGIRLIYVDHSVIRDNTVRNLNAGDGSSQYGIHVDFTAQAQILENHLGSYATGTNAAIHCGPDATLLIIDGNRSSGFSTGVSGTCTPATDHIHL